MSAQTRKRAIMEWLIMRSILKHGCGASICQIVEDLEGLSIDKERVFESLAILMQTGIVAFSIQHFDFIFNPEVAISPLAKALKSSKRPPLTVEEYVSFGWRKIAGLN